MSRNKGSKDARGRYSTPAQMQTRAKRLADSIDKFIAQAWVEYHFNKLTDFNKLHEVKDHLIELSNFKDLGK